MSLRTPLALQHPINVEGSDVTELQIRRPKLKDLKGLNLADLESLSGEALIQLISSLAEIPPSSAEQIDVADFDAIGDMIQSFFPEPKKTGD